MRWLVLAPALLAAVAAVAAVACSGAPAVPAGGLQSTPAATAPPRAPAAATAPAPGDLSGAVAITPSVGSCAGIRHVLGSGLAPPPPDMPIVVELLDQAGRASFVGENHTDANGAVLMPTPPHVLGQCRPGSAYAFRVAVRVPPGGSPGRGIRFDLWIDSQGPLRADFPMRASEVHVVGSGFPPGAAVSLVLTAFDALADALVPLPGVTADALGRIDVSLGAPACADCDPGARVLIATVPGIEGRWWARYPTP